MNALIPCSCHVYTTYRYAAVVPWFFLAAHTGRWAGSRVQLYGRVKMNREHPVMTPGHECFPGIGGIDPA